MISCGLRLPFSNMCAADAAPQPVFRLWFALPSLSGAHPEYRQGVALPPISPFQMTHAHLPLAPIHSSNRALPYLAQYVDPLSPRRAYRRWQAPRENPACTSAFAASLVHSAPLRNSFLYFPGKRVLIAQQHLSLAQFVEHG